MAEQSSPITITFHSSDRRDFIKKFGGILGGIALAGSAAAFLEACSGNNNPVAGNTNYPSIAVDVSGLTTDGSFQIVNYPDATLAPVVVYRPSATANTFQIHSMLCTHQACNIGNPSGGVMTCPCHQSKYNMTGAVVQGPATQSLQAGTGVYDPSTKKLTITF